MTISGDTQVGSGSHRQRHSRPRALGASVGDRYFVFLTAMTSKTKKGWTWSTHPSPLTPHPSRVALPLRSFGSGFPRLRGPRSRSRDALRHPPRGRRRRAHHHCRCRCCRRRRLSRPRGRTPAVGLAPISPPTTHHLPSPLPHHHPCPSLTPGLAPISPRPHPITPPPLHFREKALHPYQTRVSRQKSRTTL